MRILVTHPGRQHSHQAALALEGSGMLAGYWSGVPAVASQAQQVPAVLRKRFARYAPVPLDPARVRWFPATPALRRLGDASLPAPAAARVDFAACRLFDRWAARQLRRGRPFPSAVIACEISALDTFRAARKLGITTLLDAPSLHHTAQDRLHGTTDSPGLHRSILRVKDEEIALADHVLTVSEMARATYVEAGVAAERVHGVMLGADTALFSPGEAVERAGFTFLFSGATIHRKGFDLLLQAFDRVAAVHPDARLRIVGPAGDSAHLLTGRTGPIEVVGAVTQPELAAELRQADCLVLPSRNDSYGMVVAESLASGLPVLVSEMVGAKDLVREGENGWIVPVGDVPELASRMAWCVHHPEAVRGMRAAARKSAEQATWPAYHRRLVELLQAIVP